MSDKKKWESMEQFQVGIDQWRALAELAEARVAELVCELDDAESIALGALDAALANGEERDSEKVRREAAEARVAVLEELLSEAICYDWEPECPPKELMERIDKALAGRKEG
jgi:hypothetical protein